MLCAVGFPVNHGAMQGSGVVPPIHATFGLTWHGS